MEEAAGVEIGLLVLGRYSSDDKYSWTAVGDPASSITMSDGAVDVRMPRGLSLPRRKLK